MARETRLWIGITILAVILLNYLSIGIPLYNRAVSLDGKIKLFTKNSEDAYIVDVLKKEAILIDKKIVMLNCIGASLVIVAVSWLVFGLVFRRENRRRP